MLIGLSSLSRCHIRPESLRCRAGLSRAWQLVNNAGCRFSMPAPSTPARCFHKQCAPQKVKLHFGEVAYSLPLNSQRSVRPGHWGAAPELHTACTPKSVRRHSQQHVTSLTSRCLSSAVTEQAPAQQQAQIGATPGFRRRTTVKDIKVRLPHQPQSIPITRQRKHITCCIRVGQTKVPTA